MPKKVYVLVNGNGEYFETYSVFGCPYDTKQLEKAMWFTYEDAKKKCASLNVFVMRNAVNAVNHTEWLYKVVQVSIPEVLEISE